MLFDVGAERRVSRRARSRARSQPSLGMRLERPGERSVQALLPSQLTEPDSRLFRQFGEAPSEKARPIFLDLFDEFTLFFVFDVALAKHQPRNPFGKRGNVFLMCR